MFDTHCHLTDPRLFEQIEPVLQRAKDAGVTRMVTIGCDLEDDQAVIEIAAKYPQVRCAIGAHPNYVEKIDRARLPELNGLHQNPAVVALGEMGLDYHYDRSPREKQREFFEFQLQLAQDVKKPVVIHCREAVNDTLSIMANFRIVDAVFHCFTGTMEESKRIVAAGYHLGFDGPITYKKNDDLRAIVASVPLDRILLETDAPYLSPEPVRNIKTNEPAFVVHTGKMVAQVKNMGYDEVARIVTENANRFYRWK